MVYFPRSLRRWVSIKGIGGLDSSVELSPASREKPDVEAERLRAVMLP